MLDRGIYRMEDYVEGGWVTGLKYEDELIKDLEKRTGSNPDKLKSVRFLWSLYMGLTTQQEELDRYADRYRLGSSHHGHSTWAVLCKGRCYRSSSCHQVPEQTFNPEHHLSLAIPGLQVGLKKYASVSPRAFGLVGKKRLAVIRAAGAIVGGSGGSP